MTIYATLYSNYGMSMQVSVSPRVLPSQNGKPQKKREEDDPLIKKHRSKKGTHSLIFDPTIAITISSWKNNDCRVVFQLRQIYQILTTLTTVYEDLVSDKKLFIKDGGTLTIDKAKASAKARRIPSFSNSLMVGPAVFDNENGGTYGISFSTEAGTIAVIPHQEARVLIESISHFDANTYSLVMALIDELQGVNGKLDVMQAGIDDIRRDIKKLIENTNKDVKPQTEEYSGIKWRSSDRSLF